MEDVPFEQGQGTGSQSLELSQNPPPIGSDAHVGVLDPLFVLDSFESPHAMKNKLVPRIIIFAIMCAPKIK